jgi:hypothetical protein
MMSWRGWGLLTGLMVVCEVSSQEGKEQGGHVTLDVPQQGVMLGMKPGCVSKREDRRYTTGKPT